MYIHAYIYRFHTTNTQTLLNVSLALSPAQFVKYLVNISVENFSTLVLFQ